MDLKQLEYMIAIADHGNITKAAEALFITQSGLNQQLIRLEKELNVQLFDRNKRRLHPTQAGRIYIDHAREILKIKHDAYSLIQDLADNTSGDIYWGLPFEHGVDMFLYVSSAFNKRYPGITIHLQEHKVSEQHELLSKGLLDFIFVMLNDKDKQDHNEYIHLCNENLVLGIPTNHPMASRAASPGEPLNTIDLSHFRNDSFCLMFAGSTQRSIIDPLFEHAGFKPNLFCESTMNRTLSKLVEYNLCCTIMPESYARHNRAAWFYLTEDPHWEWCIAYSKAIHLTKPAKYLIELAKDYAFQMEHGLIDTIPET